MIAVGSEHAMMLAAVLFLIGLVGVLVRRNLLFVLLSLEIMLNAAALALVVAGAANRQPDGQAMFILVLATAGAEVAVGLSLAVLMMKRIGTLDVDRLRELRDKP